MSVMETNDDLTAQTTELLQVMIRNECVNDGTIESGEEVRNSDLLETYLEGAGLDIEHYDAAEGRRSVVARIEGSDPEAPSLCLMGHTDVVPVSPTGWTRDPFSGDLIDGEIWGRGAIDMLLGDQSSVGFLRFRTVERNLGPSVPAIPQPWSQRALCSPW